MGKIASEHLVERLVEWGVDTVFGLPGDGINGIMEALRKRSDEVRFIQVRHEEAAAFMATAYAKYTGRLGVCLATSGPGAIHLLNGLYDAKLDHQPVVAIVGQQKTFSLGSNYQQEVDLNTLFKDVASEFVQTCMSPPQVRHLVDRAVQVVDPRLERDGEVDEIVLAAPEEDGLRLPDGAELEVERNREEERDDGHRRGGERDHGHGRIGHPTLAGH